MGGPQRVIPILKQEISSMVKPHLITAILAAGLFANLSFGHAKLVSSSPASGAQVTESPKSLTLLFSEEAKLAALKLTAAGAEISVPIDKAAPSAKTVVVPLTTLAPGTYEVHWTAIATDDGHVTRGSFQFTLLPASRAH
jgi:methionine-rich copper-binding protein CopC